MEQKKSINLGFRGWMLVLYQAIAFVTYQAFTNYPLNILSDFYGGAQKVSMIYSICGIIGILIQLALGGVLGRLKSIRNFSIILGAATLVLGFGIMAIPPSSLALWSICYGLEIIVSMMYATFTVSILVGQWFPTRKGTIMGIATCAFPLANGLLGPFSSKIFGQGPENAVNNVFGAFLPFFIVFVIGWLIGLIFIRDFPEQCGAYRDNDKSLTPEIARKMMEQEIQDRKTTVWRLGQILSCGDFWLITVPMGALLMVAVGMMTQTNAIVASFNGNYGQIMGMIMIFGLIGSYVLGLIDTKFGTKTSMMIAVVMIVIAGVLGMIGSSATITLALIFVALFMGASSNYTVSGAMQYWRREDFPSVFSAVNPIANIICNIGPMAVGAMIGAGLGTKGVFTFALAVGIVAVICMLLFRPSRIKDKDDRLRKAAGKQVDDALANRK